MKLLILPVSVLCFVTAIGAPIEKKYGPGVSDTEIKIGNLIPYSGAVSAFATLGLTEAAYFRMINDSGGINGRKINFISLDTASSPPKTLEMARRLVEHDRVLLIFSPLGTATNLTIRKYMNDRKVPQLFICSPTSKWNDPGHFPWTMGWMPDSQFEGRLYAQQVLQHTPNARIGVLYQNDEFGKDYVKGFRDGLGAKSTMIVAELSYESTAPTVDSQIVQLKGAGADVFFNASSPKQAAQAIRKAYDIGWKPIQYLIIASSSIGSVLTPAGLEKATGIISAGFLKDPTEPGMALDPAVIEWTAFMKQYYAGGSLSEQYNVWGHGMAETMVHVLKQAGDDLTRENVMKQAASLKDFAPSMMLPGIKLNTSATDYAPAESLQLKRFDGQQWVAMGKVSGR